MTLLNGSDHDRESGQCSLSKRSVPRQLGALGDERVVEGHPSTETADIGLLTQGDRRCGVGPLYRSGAAICHLDAPAATEWSKDIKDDR